MHLSALGKQGIGKLAGLNLQKAHYAAERISRLDGFELAFASPYFNEFVVKTNLQPAKIEFELIKDKILGGLDLRNISSRATPRRGVFLFLQRDLKNHASNGGELDIIHKDWLQTSWITVSVNEIFHRFH